MNAEKLKKELSNAIELAQAAHDSLVDILTDQSIPTEIWMRLFQPISDLATLKWYLKHVSEEVSA